MASINGKAHGSNVLKESKDKQKCMNKKRNPKLINKALQKKGSSTELELQFVTKNNKAVVIFGLNNTKIDKQIYDNINWDKNKASSAVKAMLVGVFSREILATHCLTGKPSNAFKNDPNKKAKKPLDSKKVADITQLVCIKSEVTPNIVRKFISSKCTDENKLLKIRLKKMGKGSNRSRTNSDIAAGSSETIGNKNDSGIEISDDGIKGKSKSSRRNAKSKPKKRKNKELVDDKEMEYYAKLKLQFVTKNNKAVVIFGLNNTEINKVIYDNIDWDVNKASAALRALLVGVFPREIIATHCLTGKCSNAFKNDSNKIAKKQLNPKKVADITQLMCYKSKVTPSIVRKLITAKCADENKLLKKRSKKMEKGSNRSTTNLDTAAGSSETIRNQFEKRESEIFKKADSGIGNSNEGIKGKSLGSNIKNIPKKRKYIELEDDKEDSRGCNWSCEIVKMPKRNETCIEDDSKKGNRDDRGKGKTDSPGSNIKCIPKKRKYIELEDDKENYRGVCNMSCEIIEMPKRNETCIEDDSRKGNSDNSGKGKSDSSGGNIKCIPKKRKYGELVEITTDN